MAYHQHHPTPRSGSGSTTGSGFHFLNSPFGDTTETKVFVGGLAWETKNESLRQYFEQFGEILEAVVITDKNTGRSKGYGFVTFRDPESAKRACADPSPVVDGRRANCNLASLKRTWPAPSPARMRPTIPFIGGPQGLQGSFVGGSAYPQQIPYNYPHGFMHPQYGYMTYGQPEYVYPQNVVHGVPGQQYVVHGVPGQQYVVHGVPGSMNPVVCPPLGQLAQHVPTGHVFTAPQGYAAPGYHFMQFPGPNVNGAASDPIPSIQTSYPPGVAGGAVGQPMFVFPTHSPQFPQGSGPDQNIS